MASTRLDGPGADLRHPRSRHRARSRRRLTVFLTALTGLTTLAVIAALALGRAGALVERPEMAASGERRAAVKRLLRQMQPAALGALAVAIDSGPVSTDTTDAGVRRPALPRPVPFSGARFHAPGAGRTHHPATAADLHRVLRDALPGDQILLRRGAIYEGAFTLAAKPGRSGRWITIRTDLGTDSLAAHSRMTAALANERRLARLQIATNGANPALGTQGAASGWRIVEVEITASPAVTQLSDLVRFGDPDLRDLRQVARDLVLDRVYLHGRPETPVRRCLQLQSAAAMVINSTLDECHTRGSDNSAIGAWAGPGPYHIENNYIAGAGMGIFIGGASPRVQNLVPSDIVIRRNHITRPSAWRGRWTVKNLLELKLGRRVLIEENVFENHWSDAQSGMAILLKSVDQEGDAPWSTVGDVTLRYNVLRFSPGGLSIAARPEEYPATPAHRIAVEDNLIYAIGENLGTVYGRMLMLFGPLEDVIIARNTMFHDGHGQHAMLLDDQPSRRIEVRNNLFTRGEYGVWASAGEGAGALEATWPGSWTFHGNMVLASAPSSASRRYPDDASTVRARADLVERATRARAFADVRSIATVLSPQMRAGVHLDSLAMRLRGVAPAF